MSRLLRRGTMTERFKLPMTKEQAYQLLLAAVKGEVEYRARKFEFNDAVKSYADTIAEWLTGDSSKFGLLLCGNVGNGKSTFVKAFQQLLNQLNLRSEDNRDYWKIRIIDARTVAYLCKSDYREWEELGHCRCWQLTTSEPNLWKFRTTATSCRRWLTCSPADTTSSFSRLSPPTLCRRKSVLSMASASVTASMK